MRNISDNELDKLFQDAAQHIEPEFDPGDWDKLSKRIGRSERINLFRRMGIYLSLALLIIFPVWLGIKYYQEKSDIKNDSAGKSEAGIEREAPGNTVADQNASRTGTNASAEYAGIDGDDNGTSTGSEQVESSASESGNEASLSSGSTAAQKSDAIAAGQDRAAIASTTADQSVSQSAFKNRKNGKSDIAAQSAASARTNPNGNSINKSAEDADGFNNRQRIQKQKRTVGGEKKKRDEGSLSASDNSDANHSEENEKSSTQTAINTRSNERIKNNSKHSDETIASDSKQFSSADITTGKASGEKQKSFETNSDTLTITNARTGVTNNAVIQNGKTSPANNQSNSSVETEANANAKTNASSDRKYTTEGSIGAEKATDVVLNNTDRNSASKGDSLQHSMRAVEDVNSDTKGISHHDTIAADNNRKHERINATGKTVAGGIENTKGQPINAADRVTPGSDTAFSKSEASESNDTRSPFEKDKSITTSSSENNSIAKQNISPATGISADSLSDQRKTSAAELRESATAINDSIYTKPVAKKDSTERTENQKAVDENKPEADKNANTSNWYMKLLVSPDLSAIGYNKPGKTGVNIGLMAEYSPSKHWGISMGAIWSKKLYDKKNPGKSYSYGGTWFEADYLDGDCRVLDIPINITYYILPEARLNFYATLGVSSYIMLKEDYVYTVTENNYKYYYYEDYKNQNRHWFSMLNLSFGLQYKISPRLQLQAEPFLKVPMSGVGQGKIDLVSAGSFFTLKYKIK